MRGAPAQSRVAANAGRPCVLRFKLLTRSLACPFDQAAPAGHGASEGDEAVMDIEAAFQRTASWRNWCSRANICSTT